MKLQAFNAGLKRKRLTNPLSFLKVTPIMSCTEWQEVDE